MIAKLYKEKILELNDEKIETKSRLVKLNRDDSQII